MMRKSRVTVAIAIAFVLAVVILPGNAIASSSKQDSVSYVVRRGDNLSSIARRFGSTVGAIVQANGLATTVIWPGQTLVVPSASGQSPAIDESSDASIRPASGGFHVVRSGESLWSIANRYGVSVNALKRVNGLSGDVILPGQTLSIPASSASESRPDSGPGSPSLPSSRPSTCAGSYTVKPGDTLSSIAARCGVSIRLLREANHITGSAIYRGQTLTIPAPTSTVPWSPPGQGTATTPYAPPSLTIPIQPPAASGSQQTLEIPFPTPVPPFPPLSYPLPGQ